MEYSNSQIKAAIEEWIHSERDRMILLRRKIDGLTFERLSEEFAMSPRQIQNIVYKGEEILYKHI